MRFLYLRIPGGHRIGCVATERLDDHIKFAISVCNPLDTFKPEQAKALAMGRLAIEPLGTLTIDPNGQTKRNLLQWLSLNRSIPQRARTAAAHMLSTLNPSPNRGPNSVDPPPPSVTAAKTSEGHKPPRLNDEVTFSTKRHKGEKLCNCRAGHKVAGRYWHPYTTPGCIMSLIPTAQADGTPHAERDGDFA